MDERKDDPTGAELQALGDLPRGLPARPEVEHRIVSALAARGLIRAPRRPSRGRQWLKAAAAGLALLAAGFALGRGFAARPRAAAPAAPRFALLLLRGAERLEDPEEEASRVAEYRAWARGLAVAGRSVTGEKLEDAGQRLGASSSAALPPEEEIRGFFVISAANFQDALAVASGCPHLLHGGRILVRPIAPV